VSSDDPSYFGGYVNDSFNRIAEAVNLKQQHLVTRNAIEASFLDQNGKQALLKRLEDWMLYEW